MSHETNSRRYGTGDEPIPGYRLIECIGRGGYGEVWKTTAPGGVSKAIKLILDEVQAHGTTELLAMNRIKDVRHPFLLSIERIEQRPGTLAIVTELADGNLQQHCQKYREKGLPGIPQNELLAMLRDVADVLDFIYQEYALQHLDIKAANLLVFGKRLKAGDFGLVKNIYERSANLINGMTPAYAAPEIFGGKPSSASDQYSLAIVYQEMLTGTLPFSETSPGRLAMQHLHETPNLKALPVEQQPIIARALSKDPQHRFPSCTEMIEELAAACKRAAAAEAEATPFRDIPLAVKPVANPEKGAASPARPIADRAASTVVPTPTKATQSVSNLEAGSDDLLSPTLVIGLGGAAGRVLQQLRQRLIDRLGESTATPAFQMLFIDSVPETISQIERENRDRPGLQTLQTPLLTAADYRSTGQKHRRWLSRRWLFNIPRSLRTDGLRPLGRLAMLSHPGAVKATLRKAIQQLAKVEPICLDGRRIAGPPRVLIVSSISGGTGSGMLLDLAYAARAELQLSGLVSGTVEGLLLHSTPVGAERDKAILNAIATLQELAHYSRPGKFYPGEPFLDVPPFHGNNRTFSRVQFMHLGDQLESHQWLSAHDEAAEHVFVRLTTPRHAFGPPPPVDSDAGLTLEAVQLRQIGAYSGSFLADLSRQLCIDIIRGWCGLPLKSEQGNRSSQHATEMIQTILEQDEQTKYQDLIDEAPLKVHETGVDLEQLVLRAREMLLQELAADHRSYLQTMFQQAVQAGKADKSGHELASLVLSLQDRAIGLDFGERPNDPNRNTLFDLLHSRLASQAMQLAAKFTTWIHDLVDHPEAGVEAARCAAESGRNYLNDLVGSMAKEIHEIHKQQIESRIMLTSPAQWGDALKTGSWWTSRRAQQQQQEMLEQRLVEHGLMCLEELVLVCVQLQLQAVVAQASAVIDKLNCFGHELKQFAHQFAADSHVLPEPGNAPLESERALQHLLLEHRHRLVRELRRQIDQDVLAGPKKLQRFLSQGGSLDQELWLPLRQRARSIVLKSMRQVLLILLQHGQPAGDSAQFDLDAILDQYLSEPATWGDDPAGETFLVTPSDASSAQIERRFKAAGYNVRAVAAPVNNVSVCRIAAAVSVNQLLGQIALHQPTLVKLAENLHARTDVAWGSAAELTADNRFSAALAAAEQAEFPGTLCLSQIEADE